MAGVNAFHFGDVTRQTFLGSEVNGLTFVGKVIYYLIIAVFEFLFAVALAVVITRTQGMRLTLRQLVRWALPPAAFMTLLSIIIFEWPH